MRRIDEQYLKTPFFGSRRMAIVLANEAEEVNRKRVKRLMGLMGLEAIHPGPRTTEEALRGGKPEIFNTDQGVQYAARSFTGRLESAGVLVSMDGRGRALDNVFVERLWRSLRY